jgi:hypothetical protein
VQIIVNQSHLDLSVCSNVSSGEPHLEFKHRVALIRSYTQLEVRKEILLFRTAHPYKVRGIKGCF